jgi:putative DNA primase/helicase
MNQSANIPEELKQRNQWVAWKAEARRAKRSKTPKNPHTGKNASIDKRNTWGTYSEAVEACTRYGFDGIGFVFTEHDEFAGIDLDDCIDNGEIALWAKQIIKAFNSYTEISPSGTGIKIFIKMTHKGESLKGIKKGNIELYSTKRFFTVTGERYYDIQ